MKKRLVSILLCAVLALTMLPLHALAEGETSPSDLPAAEETADAPVFTPDAELPEEDVPAPAEPAPDNTEEGVSTPTELPEAELLPDVSDTDETGRHYTTGSIPEPCELSYPTLAADGARVPGATFAASYMGKSTPVKDQGSNGLCWDFTSISLLETHLLYKTGNTYDFSELHMAYAMSNTQGNVFGEDRKPSEGGSRAYAATYMMRGMRSDGKGGRLCLGGAIWENQDPYISTELPERYPGVTFYNRTKVCMPSDYYFLGGAVYKGKAASADVIKSAILQYGAVGAALYWDDGNDNGNLYYNKTNHCLYRPTSPGTTNHEVTIVGWDDNYSRYNFNAAYRPDRNGAWRVKNSWGTDWGENGYGWISYYDAVFPSYACTVNGVEWYDCNTTTTYEEDLTCYDGTWSPYSGKNLYMRYFTADQDTAIRSVRVFVSCETESQVEVDVVSNLNDGNFGRYKFTAKGSRSAPYTGWYTIKLNSFVQVKKGNVFGVIVRTDAGVGYDAQAPKGADYGWQNSDGTVNWKYKGSESTDGGWCIKAVGDTDLNELMNAQARLSSGSSLWDMIKGENTSSGDLRFDLASPGAVPNTDHTTFTYNAMSLIDENGQVTRPEYGGTAQTQKLKVTLHCGIWSVPVSISLTVQPYQGTLQASVLPDTVHKGGNIKVTVTRTGSPGDVSYQWYRSTSATGTGSLRSGLTNRGINTYSDAARDYWYYCVISAPDAAPVTTNRCREDYTTATDHVWDDGTVSKEPEVGAEGKMLYHCTGCMYTKTEAIPMLMEFSGNVWGQGDGDWVLDICTDQGQFITFIISSEPVFRPSALESGSYRLRLKKYGCITREFPLTWEDGQVRVTLPDTRLVSVGNCNGDDNTDVTDMACLFTYLSTGQKEGMLADDDDYFRTIADVNRDGTINILDYQSLYAQLH